MIDLDKLQQAAEAAIAIQHSSGDYWYDAEDFFDGLDADEDAEFASACRPQTILKLIAVARAAKATMTVDQDDTVESLAADLTLYAALEVLK